MFATTIVMLNLSFSHFNIGLLLSASSFDVISIVQGRPTSQINQTVVE